MNTKDFRAAVNTELLAWRVTNFPTLPLIFENGPVPDEDNIGPIWFDTEIRWYGAKGMAIGEMRSGRHSGAVSASVYYRDALGTGQVDDILDSLTNLLKTRRIGGSVIRFPSRTVPTSLRGWYKSGLLFPFTLDV